MTISVNGQVSIPAAARTRWRTRKVLVVDMGDRVVVRPLVDDPIDALMGKYAGRGPDSTSARAAERSGEDRGGRAGTTATRAAPTDR